MPGFLLTQGTIAQCSHMGAAKPAAVSPRVKVMGQPVALFSSPWTIAACTQLPPPNGNGPDVVAQWTLGSVRVKVNGLPVLLSDGKALCTPTGTPLSVKLFQQRVKGI